MGMTYNDEHGQARVPIMGCYGIGIGRLMSSVMEARHDQYGPKWPMSIAPWQVHVNAIKLETPGVREVAERLYADLIASGVDVVYDDRDARPGVQFADADLLGVPLRFIVSERNTANGVIEWKRRDTGDAGTVKIEEAHDFAKALICSALESICSKANESTINENI
jgi:prolyl-tRNA synthetase